MRPFGFIADSRKYERKCQYYLRDCTQCSLECMLFLFSIIAITDYVSLMKGNFVD
jgi:hypothetical protein